MTTPNNVTPINSNAAAWGTATGTQQPYSPNSFYVGTRDANGEYEQIRLKVPAWIYREIVRLVNSNEIPSYQSPHDVLRDALHHRFHYVKDNIALPPMRMALQEATAQMMAEQYVLDVQRSLDRREEYVQHNTSEMERCATYQLWDLLANLIYRARMTMDHEVWSGVQYEQLRKVCDDYETKVPQEYRRPYLG